MKNETVSSSINITSPSTFSRRSFLGRASAVSVASALPLVGLLGSTSQALGENTAGVPMGDIAILQFLAAAELLECDLWGQYAELATNNPGFRRALRKIDDSLPDYVRGDYEDECSHAEFINAYLRSVGAQPINLDSFRTLRGSSAKGAKSVGRLTSLASLTVDTSWYARYRSPGNPDFGDSFPQIATLVNLPTIPMRDNIGEIEMLNIAQTAAFHFCAIEQGGSSLYNALSTQVTDQEVLAILLSIGPTEVYHFAVFQGALEGIRDTRRIGGRRFPNIRRASNRGAIMPKPCKFLDAALPLCSTIRPRRIVNAGAGAAVTGLSGSGLFTGQSQAFVTAAVGLATAADAAVRGRI